MTDNYIFGKSKRAIYFQKIEGKVYPRILGNYDLLSAEE